MSGSEILLEGKENLKMPRHYVRKGTRNRWTDGQLELGCQGGCAIKRYEPPYCKSEVWCPSFSKKK